MRQPVGDPGEGSWAEVEAAQRRAWADSTPAERLAWLESALDFAARVGALRRDRLRREERAAAWQRDGLLPGAPSSDASGPATRQPGVSR